jgi:GT2 family glycosyltransferase
VTVLLVTHDGGVYLDRTLEALAAQTRTPDRLVVVDIGSRQRVTELPAVGFPVQHLAGPPSSTFGEAITLAVRSLAPASSDDQWLWLLSADNAPEAGALAAMLAAVEISPSVAVAGPKLMQWADPQYLYSYGETLTPLGTSVELAEPLLDQAQYDRESDVTAVSSAGMLVRHRLWEQLGGFDRGLPAMDDALDFCIRARLAGHRVSLVPDARVLSAGRRAPGTAVIGPRTSRAKRERLTRTAQLHRRLVYAPALALPLHWLSLLPLAVLRALGQLLRKQPGSVVGEFAAAFAVAFGHPGRVVASRRRLAQTRKLSWSALAQLRLPWAEIRRRRSLAREETSSARRAGRHEIRFVASGGAAVVLVAGVVGLLVHLPLFGAPAVAAPALLPLNDIGTLWSQVGFGWRALGAGFAGAADPFVWVLALLGSLTFWSPSASIVVLYLLALPLAALAGWFAAARLTASPWLRVVAAVGWTLAPSFLFALDQGRLGAIVAHLLLPWLFFALTTARRSWEASAAAGLLGAAVLASAPSLWPALRALWLIVTISLAAAGRRGRGWHRLVPLPLPAAVLFLPLALQHLVQGTPLGVLADPGILLSQAGTAGEGLAAPPLGQTLAFLAGLPEATAAAWSASAVGSGLSPAAGLALAIVLAAPLLVLALAAPFLRGAPKAVAALVVAALGFATAVLAARLPVASVGADAVGPWPGPGLSLLWLGLLAAVVFGLSAGELALARVLRGALGAVVAVGVVAAAAPLLVSAALGGSHAVPGAERTVPALVAAQAASDPTLGTLVLSGEHGNGLTAGIERGTGAKLDDQSTLFNAAPADVALGDSLAVLAGNLASRGGYNPVPALEAQRIGFVLLTPATPESRAVHDRVTAALDGNPLFAPVTRTAHGTLWRYTGLDAGLPTAAPAGPDNLATPFGLGVLGVQLLVLILTLLLALPTAGLAESVRPEREARRGSGVRGTRAVAPAGSLAASSRPSTGAHAAVATPGGARHGE